MEQNRRKRRKDYGSRTFPARCPRCGIVKERDEFPDSKASASGKYTYCRDCKSAYNREHKARSRGTELEAEKLLRAALRRAGATREWWDQRLAECGGRCEICGEPPKRYARLSIDHNHETGELRGLLCKDCNNALGLLGDHPEKLRAALQYLTERGHYGS